VRLLLDTHALLWWAGGTSQLSRPARVAIAEETNDVFVSAASAWEIATKHRLGKLDRVGPLLDDLPGYLDDQDFQELGISVRHAQRAGALPGPHRDPFDRMLVAQAQIEGLTLVSNEEVFDRYGVKRLW
jgi:PIN domain nuclease of toxin-antitoxin system